MRDGWNARRVDAQDVAVYSRFVGLMKIILPSVAALLIALVLLYSAIGGNNDKVALTYEKLEAQKDDMQLVKPKLTGTDGRGQPFTVTARAAKQEFGKVQRLTFFEVTGDITLEDKSWMAVEAQQGLLDADAKRMTMTGPINIYSDRGYECHTDGAIYDMASGVLSGARPVNCQGPLGLIQANGFEGLRKAGQMKFTGGVKTQFFPPPRNAKAAAQAAAAKEAEAKAAAEKAAASQTPKSSQLKFTPTETPIGANP
jgi:lipopolysaccharide export system protein LptC